MVNMIATIKISEGWDTWSKMVKGLEPQMNKVGSKVLQAGCNADETAVYVLVEMNNPSFIKSFGEREDIVAIREAGGADVSSTTPITQISNYFFGQQPLEAMQICSAFIQHPYLRHGMTHL